MNLNEWMQNHLDLFSSSPPPSNSDIMYYKQSTYKYVTNGQDCVIPAEAPSGWYEVRVTTKPMLMEGLATVMFYGVLDQNEPNSSTARSYKPDYAPWFSSTAQSVGVDFNEPEGDTLVLSCNVLNGIVSQGDVGFIGFAKHLSGSETRVCSLPQPMTAPSVSDLSLGSYIIRQVTQ